MKIEAQTKNIEKLKNYFFIVPDYQREFIWEADKHVLQFLEDINNEFHNGGEGKSHTNYFIGSIIIVKRADDTFEVIDGQQRLTTIILTLCALRDQIKEYPNTIYKSKDFKDLMNELLKKVEELLYDFSIKDKKRKPRLVLQYEESKDYLVKLIEGENYKGIQTNSIKRMKESYSTISEFIKRMDT